jgi:hypothetical protein
MLSLVIICHRYAVFVRHAGCDGFLPQHLQAAITDGAVQVSQLDLALTHQFGVRCVTQWALCEMHLCGVLSLFEL